MMLRKEAERTEPTRATRLMILQVGTNLKVISRQSLKMRVPSSDPTYGVENQSGFWFEVRSDQKESFYRRILPNPFTDEVEAPSGDPERPFTTVTIPDQEHIAVLLVPEL